MPERIPEIDAWWDEWIRGPRALAGYVPSMDDDERMQADLHATVAALLAGAGRCRTTDYCDLVVKNHEEAHRAGLARERELAALLEKEGERCAKIAEGRARSVEFFNDGIEIGFNDACEEIAAAIREARHA